METQTPNWEMAKMVLGEARDCLRPNAENRNPTPRRSSGTLGKFKELLEHNELERAWNTLADAADIRNAPEIFWRKLAQAARLLELPFEEAVAFRRGNLPPDWDIRREGRQWTRAESGRRIYQAPEKIEFVGGIFASDRERLTVLGMLLETLGIDKVIRFGKLSDWKAAIADLEKEEKMPKRRTTVDP